jgi:hypothetical protein
MNWTAPPITQPSCSEPGSRLKRQRVLAAALGLIGIAWLSTVLADEPSGSPLPAADRSGRSAYARFADWKAACDRLPSNRSLKLRFPPRDLLPLQSFEDFRPVLDSFFALCQTGELAELSAWSGPPPTREAFFNTAAAYFQRPTIPFQPFAQRCLVPPGAEVLFHGDLHGDIHSLNTWLAWLNQTGYLRDFQIARPDAYLVFLGDYTDRGLYGVEVLYTILRLKLANPERVLLVRGNHEDVSLAARYGFLAEGQAKYGAGFDARAVMRLYDFLPVVLYLGCGDTFIQCNHGGMEPGYDPGALLDAPDGVRYEFLGELKQAQFVKAHPLWVATLPKPSRRIAEGVLKDFLPVSPTEPAVLGFMWNDFSVVAGEADLAIDPGRAFIYGPTVTRLLLEQASTSRRRVHAVFRAHQHANTLTPMMRRLKASRGIFRHWQQTDALEWLDADPTALAARLETAEQRPIPPSSVWTFNVSPDSLYGEGCDFDFDTFGILTTAEAVEDWRVRVVNLPVRPTRR